MQILGPSLQGFCYLPAIQSRGGILLGWNTNKVSCSSTCLRDHSIAVKVIFLCRSCTWLTVVYGLNDVAQKSANLQEMRDISSSITGPCMILGDFNLILQSQDKSNGYLNRHLINGFSHVIDDLKLKEVHLNGRSFTWTNTRERPTLERIDWVFVMTDCELLFPNCLLHALPSRLQTTAHSYYPRCSTSAPRSTFDLKPFG